MAVRSVGIFGSETRTQVLLVVHMLQTTYPTQVAEILGISLNQAQKAIESLDRAGLTVGTVEGRQRRVSLNPRNVYGPEVAALLDKMALHEVGLQRRLGEIRRRPRRTGKDLE